MDRDEIIRKHQGIVIKIARKWTGRGLDFLDLVQEGNLGLLAAYEKFDPDKGVKFITYAVPYVRKFIREAALNKGAIVRVPLHIQREAHQKKEKARKIEALYGHTVELCVARDPISLAYDDNVRDKVFSAQNQVNPLIPEVIEAIPALTWAEVIVIRLRFVEGYTLEACGDAIGRTKSRIQQIEKGALSKLRKRIAANRR